MLRTAILVAFDAPTYKAEIKFLISNGAVLTDIAVSRAIGTAVMIVDRKVAVFCPGGSNPDEWVVLAVWT